MHTSRQLKPGTRVEIRESQFLLKLRANTGTVVRKDDYLDYYIIRLDKPAIYCAPDGETEDLPEIRESAANLNVLKSFPRRDRHRQSDA